MVETGGWGQREGGEWGRETQFTQPWWTELTEALPSSTHSPHSLALGAEVIWHSWKEKTCRKVLGPGLEVASSFLPTFHWLELAFMALPRSRWAEKATTLLWEGSTNHQWQLPSLPLLRSKKKTQQWDFLALILPLLLRKVHACMPKQPMPPCKAKILSLSKPCFPCLTSRFQTLKSLLSLLL